MVTSGGSKGKSISCLLSSLWESPTILDLKTHRFHFAQPFLYLCIFCFYVSRKDTHPEVLSRTFAHLNLVETSCEVILQEGKFPHRHRPSNVWTTSFCDESRNKLRKRLYSRENTKSDSSKPVGKFLVFTCCTHPQGKSCSVHHPTG